MQEDAFHATIVTGSGFMLYGMTLETVLVFMWMAYVGLLIITKLPDVFKKYPIIGRFWSAVWRIVRRR